MKIIQLTAENIKKLKVVDITPTQGMIQITGKNGSGKTSVLEAIFLALGGASGVTEQTIRKGEEKASIRLDLGDMVVIRRFTKNGTSLIIENKDGARYPSPQAMLDKLIGRLSFDPLEFSRMKPKEQFDTLRQVADVQVDFEQHAKDRRKDFDDRANLNRDIKLLEGQVAGIVVPDDAPDQGVSVAALMEELAQAERRNDVVAEAERQLDNLKINAHELERQIETLEDTLKDKREQLSNIRKRFDTHLIPDPIPTDGIKKQIAEAEQINEAYRNRQRKGELNGEIALKQKQADGMTTAIEKRDADLTAAIAAAKMPIDGLSLGDGHVHYYGIPFAALSSAEQLRVSVAIAMAANPKLRVLRIQDGSLLDEDSLKIMQEMTAKQDFQVWMERVDTSGKIGVVMEDGEVKAVNEEAA